MTTFTGRPAAIRIAVAVVAVTIACGALAGCSRTGSQEPPSSGAVSSGSTAQVPAPTASTPPATISNIQDDLNSASSADSNANGDVAAGNAAAATNDNN